MLFKNDGMKLKICVLGLEFPLSKDKDDLEWLIIKVEARLNFMEWVATDPCLRIRELVLLKDWFASILKKEYQKIPKTLYFLEPELMFSHQYEREINIFLDFNLHPKTSNYDYVKGEDGCMFSFSLSDNELEDIISQIRFWIEKYS